MNKIRDTSAGDQKDLVLLTKELQRQLEDRKDANVKVQAAHACINIIGSVYRTIVIWWIWNQQFSPFPAAHNRK